MEEKKEEEEQKKAEEKGKKIREQEEKTGENRQFILFVVGEISGKKNSVQ